MLLGVNVAIFIDGKVLLTRREDYHVWCLPGGSVDPGESVAQAAVREVQEETGLDVRLTRMVGIYSRPAWPDGGYHIVVFAAEQSGGTFSPAPNEVIEIGTFEPGALPERLLIGHHRRIQDAAAGIGGSAAVCDTAIYPDGMPYLRAEQYARRDESGLARDDFYWQAFGPQAGAAHVVEVPGKKQE